MDNVQNRFIPFLIVVGIVAGIIGLGLGLLVGWGIWPVQWTDAGPQHLSERDQQTYLRALADVHAFDNNRDRVHDALGRWEEADQAICELAAESPDPAEVARFNSLAAVLNNQGCPGVVGVAPVVPPPAQPEPEPVRTLGSLVLPCLLGLLLVGLLGAIFLIWTRQQTSARDVGHAYYSDMPEAPPMLSGGGEDQRATPIARFQSSYSRGYDTYDDSFSIENANGDFLGECGVGISESIGADSPKNVTAFEVWLFDKNDIRTVTKVIMSDHAFFDEAIKAKLAPKGEPVLARLNETVVLETASLIINAVITELEYGSGPLPPQSYFERFTVELSAWSKEGDYGEPDVQGRIDEMLNF
jgi:hypothetical protein